jgi:hypothetical protein
MGEACKLAKTFNLTRECVQYPTRLSPRTVASEQALNQMQALKIVRCFEERLQRAQLCLRKLGTQTSQFTVRPLG